MQSISDSVYIEDHYLGATLGVIQQPRGLVQVDAPPAPEDGRAWRAALMGLGSGPERVLINLDAHPDRTLGARVMDCTVIAHEKTAAVFRVRPTTFKAQGNETGSDWETIPGLGTVRWLPPEISFTNQMTLHWGEKPIILEQHPGPSSGAIWVIVPDDKVVFVGDAVLKNQPPFIAHADLPAWIEALELLMGPQYRGFTFVSGRGGTASSSAIKAQIELMEEIHEKLEKMASKSQSPESTEKLVETFANKFKASAARHKQYVQRLRYGFRHYYARHYHMGNSAEE